MPVENSIAISLTSSRQTLGLAESCTGGRLSDRLTNIPGSSNFLTGGIVAYSNALKTRLLGVSPATLKKYGAVSAEVAMAMARGVRRKIETTYGVGITGIAGPSGGSKTKPVGLVYIAVSSVHETICLKCLFTGTRTRIKDQAADQALHLLKDVLE